jgi:hypothetical protein
MANKVAPNICAPGSMTMPSGGRTDGIKKGSHARGGALAQPGRTVGKGNPQGRLPVQSPPANITGRKVKKTGFFGEK